MTFDYDLALFSFQFVMCLKNFDVKVSRMYKLLEPYSKLESLYFHCNVSRKGLDELQYDWWKRTLRIQHFVQKALVKDLCGILLGSNFLYQIQPMLAQTIYNPRDVPLGRQRKWGKSGVSRRKSWSARYGTKRAGNLKE